MLIIGCDFHPSGQQVFGIDKQTGEVVADGGLSHAGDQVDRFYASLPAGTEVGVESSGNMLWFERKLAKYGHKLRVGDEAQAEDGPTGRGVDCEADAGEQLDLAWVPSLWQRDLRQLLMHRPKLVRMRAQVKNQLQHIAMNQGQQKKRQLWTEKGRELLEKLELEGWTARRRDDLLKLLDAFTQHCDGLDAAVERAAEQDPDARLLKQHPGIGPVISLAYVLTIGDVNRFDSSRQVVSYLGLNPSENSSGQQRRLGSISKQGNSFLRLLLIQGAQTAVRGDEELGRQYRRLAARKNKAIAKVMVARKLAVRMFWILKTQKPYPEQVRMRGSSSHPGVETTAALCERPASQLA